MGDVVAQISYLDCRIAFTPVVGLYWWLGLGDDSGVYCLSLCTTIVVIDYFVQRKS